MMYQDRLSSTRYLILRAETFRSVAHRDAQSLQTGALSTERRHDVRISMDIPLAYKITVHSHSPYYDYAST